MKSNIHSYKNSQQLEVDGKVLNMKRALKEIHYTLYLMVKE